jgi:hypothetical protein
VGLEHSEIIWGILTVSQFAEALAASKIKISKYDPSKHRQITSNRGTMAIPKFCKILQEALGAKAVSFPEVFEALHDPSDAQDMIEEYAKEKKIFKGDKKVEIEIPPDMEGLTLNMNLAAARGDEKFFLTDERETVSRVSGEAYMLIHQISPLEAAAQARKVIPDYMPRGSTGVTEIETDGRKETVFNVYTPPEWMRYPKWDKLPDKLPIEFQKLVEHLFPIPEERSFFFAWLHDSLFKRSFTFLILCGIPGSGKNRLKLVMRALHGHVNSVDGKKSTLVERFNSQLSEATLAWFDELRYDVEMENMMKELQNDSISIERKGVDATRATKIHSSIVISNNKERDNYIAFDARKFAPLVIRNERLEKSMRPEEIDRLTQKVEDPKSETYDVAWIAQIAKWIKKHGASKKWANLEYRGPMFWALAHTSMTRWQKKAVMAILEPDRGQASGYDPKKNAYLWSVIQAKNQRKNGDRSLQFPDFTSIRAFFEIFRDGQGRKAFSTEPVKGNNILGDFWVKPLFKHTEIITEASVAEQRGKVNVIDKKEKYDL